MLHYKEILQRASLQPHTKFNSKRVLCKVKKSYFNDRKTLKTLLHVLCSGYFQAMWRQVQGGTESREEALGQRGPSVRDQMGSCNPLLTSTNLLCTERWHQTADSEAERHGSVEKKQTKTLQFGYWDGGTWWSSDWNPWTHLLDLNTL